MAKSGYMAINEVAANKSEIVLNCGTLHYKPRQTDLDEIVSDSGKLQQDDANHARSKRPPIAIKLVNFIRCNTYCLVWIKLKIMKSCINASLLYGCETWSCSGL